MAQIGIGYVEMPNIWKDKYENLQKKSEDLLKAWWAIKPNRITHNEPTLFVLDMQDYANCADAAANLSVLINNHLSEHKR